MQVLGIGYYVAHDSNIALTNEGKIKFAGSEERFSRKKHDGAFPDQALTHAMSYLKQGHISIVAPYNDNSQYDIVHKGILDQSRYDKFVHLQRENEKILRNAKVTEFLGHHFSHAAGAYYTSGFSNAVVITYDGGIVCEPWLATVWEGKDRILKPLQQITRLDGATAAIRYSAVTSLLGFRPVYDEGKVTGLAARGKPNEDCIKDLIKAFDSQPDPTTYYSGQFAQDFIIIRKKYSASDIAASIQLMTEDAVISLLSKCVPDPTKLDCVMAGGLFANVLLNLRIKRMGFKRIYVYPAMGDEGLGIGAALAYSVSQGGNPEELNHIYFGSEYSDLEIENSLKNSKLSYKRYEEVELVIATLLARGKVIARFNGRMEFGPRALGNRSILYQANDPSVNEWLNKKLGRTETMPFAPVTLSTEADKMYLELEGLEKCTPFMTTVVPCSKLMRRLSTAVVHLDGTARPQIVYETTNPSLYKIISEYLLLTGLPTLINTSFNLHGEPIVCSPKDAVQSFLRGGIDYLAIGNYIVQHPYIE